MTKRIALAFVSIMLAFSFAGCGAETQDNPTETVTVTASPEVSERSMSDEEFAGIIRENTSVYDASPTEDIVGLAETICQAFDEGQGFEDVAYVLINAGAEPYDAGFMVGASVAFDCPEHEALIKEYPAPNA